MLETKSNIMIVEDEGLIAAALASKLKRDGYSIAGIADSSPRALVLIENTLPDLVLMDICLNGDEDGVELADRVRQQFNIPVIYLTAFDDAKTLERAAWTQAYGYIKKPISTASLKGTIEMALSKHRRDRGLRKQMDWVTSTFAAMPYAVLVLDRHSRVTYLNSQAEELTGWSEADALNRPLTAVLQLFFHESRNPINNLVPMDMLEGQIIPLPNNICLRSRHNRTSAVEGAVTQCWRDGRMEGAVIALRDVTADRLEAAQSRQEAKQDALARMARGISRHLPDMAAAAGESARLVEALPPGSILRLSAEKLEQAAIDGDATTSYLQAFAEPPELDLELVILNDVGVQFTETFGAFEPRFIFVPTPTSMTVRLDQWQLQMGLWNIGLHARSHMEPGTALIMDILPAEFDDVGQACIRITYTTKDEDAAAFERAFEPCWSGSSEDLHITYSVVKAMGASVSTRLERGNQALFEILIPRVAAASADSSDGTLTSAPNQRSLM